jgi:hypothetical protein
MGISFLIYAFFIYVHIFQEGNYNAKQELTTNTVYRGSVTDKGQENFLFQSLRKDCGT